jgi:hypothetical protein
MSRRLSFALLIAVFAPLPVLGCGSSGSTGFDQGPPSGAQSATDGGAAGDATMVTSSGGGGDGGFAFVQPNLGDGSTVSSVCVAGVYRGKFMTLVGAGDDGGSAGLFSIMWNGNLAIDLMAKTVTITSGTGVGEGTVSDTTTLEIAEGGALEGGDMYGGNFFANLDGDLDCSPSAGPPYHLTATLFNGTYASPFYNLPIGGHLSADYQASNPPMLVNGEIFVDSMDAGLLTNASAGGTWSATWVSP